MNFSNKTENDIKLEINLTPLIDVVLQLVIFFMITTTFLAQTGIDIKLPQANAKDIKQEQELAVTISKDKKIFLNEKSVSVSELPDRLSKARKRADKSVLIIRADESVPHGLVVKVMDVAKKAGIENLAIATRPDDT